MIIQSLLSSLKKVGIKPGDLLCVSSDVAKLGIPEDLKDLVKANGITFILDSYIDTLRESVGSEGALFFPTFTYSGTKKEVFDPEKTKSTVGVLTEHFRKQPAVFRSLHPIFSVAGVGKNAKEILESVGEDCFDEKSFYGRLHQLDGKYLMLGIGMGRGSTYVYYSEQKYKVPYRYFKNFDCVVHQNGEDIQRICSYNVRNYEINYQDDWEQLEADSISEGITLSAEFNGAPLLSHKAREIDALIGRKLKASTNYLIKLLGECT